MHHLPEPPPEKKRSKDAPPKVQRVVADQYPFLGSGVLAKQYGLTPERIRQIAHRAEKRKLAHYPGRRWGTEEEALCDAVLTELAGILHRTKTTVAGRMLRMQYRKDQPGEMF